MRRWGLAFSGSLLLTGWLLFLLTQLVARQPVAVSSPMQPPIVLSEPDTPRLVTPSPLQASAPAGVTAAQAHRLLVPQVHQASPSPSVAGAVMPRHREPAARKVASSTTTQDAAHSPSQVTEQHLLYHPLPDYPQRARLMHRQGAVKIRFVVSDKGTVEDLQVLDGDPELARSAFKAIQQWRYSPSNASSPTRQKRIETITLIFRLKGGVQLAPDE